MTSLATETFGIPLAYVIVTALALWAVISARGNYAVKALVICSSLVFGVLLWFSLTDLQGFVGNFTATVTHQDGTAEQMPVGSVVVATGYREFDATRIERLGYGKHLDVITSFELELEHV